MEGASMTSENVTDPKSVESAEAVSAKAVDDQLIDELVHRAQAEGLQLTGEGGLLQQLTKRLLESALEGEITDHLGYDKHDAAGKNGGNSRNGKRSKTVLTDVGPVEITVPRDRDGSFEPKIVKKRIDEGDPVADAFSTGRDVALLPLRQRRAVGDDLLPLVPGRTPPPHGDLHLRRRLLCVGVRPPLRSCNHMAATCGYASEAVVLLDVIAAFPLVGRGAGESVGVGACRVVVPREVADAVGGRPAGTAQLAARRRVDGPWRCGPSCASWGCRGSARRRLAGVRAAPWTTCW
jgi:hypothetical protein